MSTTLNGGSFNLKVHRRSKVVYREVTELIKKWNLDFLVVQEAPGYRKILQTIPGFQYYTGQGHRGTKENAILVKDSIPVDRYQSITLGNGWRTITGARALGNAQVQVRLDGWLLVRGIHVPTPSNWRNGKIVDTPADRKDDLIEHMKAIQVFHTPPRNINAALTVGDWNEPPTTRGEYSPKWIQESTKSKPYCPSSTAGHGRIDWALAKGCTMDQIFKDLDIKQGSDHKPVIMLGIRKS